jgi:hypothetical protein
LKTLLPLFCTLVFKRVAISYPLFLLHNLLWETA